MYILRIFPNVTPWQGIIVTLTSQTEVLDFIALLHLSQNSDIGIELRYGGIKNDETKQDG